MKIQGIIIVLLLLWTSVLSQGTITGTFSDYVNQQIRLYCYKGFDKYIIDSIKTDKNGSFSLSFNKEDYGIGLLISEDETTLLLILNDEEIILNGQSFALLESIEIIEGDENKLFEKYASEHPRREQALTAWDYLEKIYGYDSLFSVHNIPKEAIDKEKQRIKEEDRLFLASLPPETFVNWYLPMRKLISSASVVAQSRTDEIPKTIAAFRNIDYTDPHLYKSGLLGDIIESHFWLIENSGRTLDSVYVEMKISIDKIVENIVTDEQKLNEITEYLFKFLEKRSLFTASEYLALKLLNEKSCTINNDLASQLESYRTMKIGNTVPDIKFAGSIVAPGYKSGNIPKKLSAINGNYIVVVFGAGWCPKCSQELQSIAQNYAKWKQYDVEVLFVSLDEEKQIFENFISIFPFISTCDYQKWESPIVKNWHIFATPTIYLLNSKREIILRPNSVNQLNSWVDWYLVKENK